MAMGIHTKSIIVLTVTCVFSATALAATYWTTKPIIEEVERAKIYVNLQEIFPDMENFIEENGYYTCLKGGVPIGYATISIGYGYGGKMRLMVGVGLDGRVVGVNVLSNSETVGIGSRITENTFLSQFIGKTSDAIKLKKDGGQIDAITGATISSTATVNAVFSGVKAVENIIGGRPR